MADWPDDPDVRAREQKLANANKPSESGNALVDPGFRLPKSQVQVDQMQDQNIDDEIFSLTGNKTEQRKLFATAKGGAAGKVDENGNPVRTALTEPPADYRVPDPTAPEEFEAASKRGLGSIFKKKPSSVAPSDDGRRHRRHRRPRSQHRQPVAISHERRSAKKRVSSADASPPLIPE